MLRQAAVLFSISTYASISLCLLYPLFGPWEENVKWRLFQMLLLYSKVERSQQGWLVLPGLP